MRSWIFNIAVIAALAYLAAGRVAPVERPDLAAMPAQTADAHATVATSVGPPVEEKLIAVPRVHQAPDGEGVGKAVVAPAPSPLPVADAASPARPVVKGTLMSAQDRRRELHALARSMEGEFVRRVLE